MANWENLDAAFAELEAECADIVRGMTVEIFLHTLQYSPQYFGRYASSWTYKIGSPEFWTNPEFDYVRRIRGMPRSTARAITRRSLQPSSTTLAATAASALATPSTFPTVSTTGKGLTQA